jgi:hypothetical protein
LAYLKAATSLAALTSQILTDSADPNPAVASRLPSGDQATEVIPSMYPERTSELVFGSQGA